MAKDVNVNGVSFDADYYQGWTEDKFVKDQINSLPGRFGNDEKKTAFLKEAYKKVVKPVVEKSK